MQMRTRKALGCFALLAYLGAYCVIAASLGATLVQTFPSWAQLIYFVIAGVAWVVPLKPLFSWMNRGG